MMVAQPASAQWGRAHCQPEGTVTVADTFIHTLPPTNSGPDQKLCGGKGGGRGASGLELLDSGGRVVRPGLSGLTSQCVSSPVK